MTSSMAGLYPAVIKAYDKNTRLCRVHIPAITGGGDNYPIAEIAYPIGEKSQTREGAVSTELEVLLEDSVWVMFVNGDPAHPIVTHYRNARAGNEVDWRRIHQKNMQIIADSLLELNAGNIELNTTGHVTINADGNVDINSAKLTHNGVDVGSDHKHDKVQTGNGNTGNPI